VTDAGPVARAVALIQRAEDALLALVLGAMILLAVSEIVLRNVFDTGLAWSAPLLRVMLLWVGLLGALAATRSDQHIAIDALSRLLPDTGRALVHALTRSFAAGVCLLIAWHAARMVIDDRAAGTLAFASVPAWLCETILPLAFGLIGVRFALTAARSLRGVPVTEPAGRP